MTDPSDTMQAATEDTPAPATPAPAPAKGRGKLLMIGLTVLVLVAVGVTGYMKYHQITTSPDKAKVNDCLSGTTAKSVELVTCSDASAKWVVVGRAAINNVPTEDEQRIICANHPETESMYMKAKSYVLCLANK
jgi:hypothetical protein